MKFTTKLKKVPGTYTRDGKTIPVTRNEEVRTPVLPRDWQTVALYGAVTVVGVLTLISVVWSTIAIGSLLGGEVGYLAALVFDLGWATALLLSYLARYDANKRTFPDRLGWVLLAITMVAIAWHGLEGEEPNWAMAVIGALVSFFAKILWMGVMRHINAELSDDDVLWLAAQISEAQTKAALATVRRQTARTEQRAALELLAMEKERREVAEAFGQPVVEAEPVAASSEMPALESPSLSDLAKADAVRFVRKQHPEMTAREIAGILEEYEVGATPTYVQQVIDRDRKAAERQAEEIGRETGGEVKVFDTIMGALMGEAPLAVHRPDDDGPEAQVINFRK